MQQLYTIAIFAKTCHGYTYYQATSALLLDIRLQSPCSQGPESRQLCGEVIPTHPASPLSRQLENYSTRPINVNLLTQTAILNSKPCLATRFLPNIKQLPGRHMLALPSQMKLPSGVATTKGNAITNQNQKERMPISIKTSEFLARIECRIWNATTKFTRLRYKAKAIHRQTGSTLSSKMWLNHLILIIPIQHQKTTMCLTPHFLIKIKTDWQQLHALCTPC